MHFFYWRNLFYYLSVCCFFILDFLFLNVSCLLLYLWTYSFHQIHYFCWSSLHRRLLGFVWILYILMNLFFIILFFFFLLKILFLVFWGTLRNINRWLINLIVIAILYLFSNYLFWFEVRFRLNLVTFIINCFWYHYLRNN